MIALWFVGLALGNAIPLPDDACSEQKADKYGWCSADEEMKACPVDPLSGRAACEKLEAEGFVTRCSTPTNEVMCRPLPAAMNLPEPEERRCATTSGTTLAGVVALLVASRRARRT